MSLSKEALNDPNNILSVMSQAAQRTPPSSSAPMQASRKKKEESKGPVVVQRAGCANLAAIALSLCVDPEKDELPCVLPPMADTVYHMTWMQTMVAVSGKAVSCAFALSGSVDKSSPATGQKGETEEEEEEYVDKELLKGLPKRATAKEMLAKFRKIKGLIGCHCMTQLRSGAVIGGHRDAGRLVGFMGDRFLFDRLLSGGREPISLTQRRFSDDIVILCKDGALDLLPSPYASPAAAITRLSVACSIQISSLHVSNATPISVTTTPETDQIVVCCVFSIMVLDTTSQRLQHSILHPNCEPPKSPAARRMWRAPTAMYHTSQSDGGIAMVRLTQVAFISSSIFALIDTTTGTVIRWWQHGLKIGPVTCCTAVGRGLVAIVTHKQEAWLIDFNSSAVKEETTSRGVKRTTTTRVAAKHMDPNSDASKPSSSAQAKVSKKGASASPSSSSSSTKLTAPDPRPLTDKEMPRIVGHCPDVCARSICAWA